MEMKQGKGFTIVGDIEAKATLAAITDDKGVQIVINGSNEQLFTMLTVLFAHVTEAMAGVSEEDSYEEAMDKTAHVGAMVLKAVGGFFTEKYASKAGGEQ